MKFHFNGWQRIWIVISVLSLALSINSIYESYRSPSLVEDPLILAQLNDNQVLVVDVPGRGLVSLPRDISEKEIEELVQQSNFPKNMNTIIALAKTKIQVQNEQQAAEAMKGNDIVRKANRQLLLFGFAGWLAFVVIVYLGGWCVGWIYRGFKAT